MPNGAATAVHNWVTIKPQLYADQPDQGDEHASLPAKWMCKYLHISSLSMCEMVVLEYRVAQHRGCRSRAVARGSGAGPDRRVAVRAAVLGPRSPSGRRGGGAGQLPAHRILAPDRARIALGRSADHQRPDASAGTLRARPRDSHRQPRDASAREVATARSRRRPPPSPTATPSSGSGSSTRLMPGCPLATESRASPSRQSTSSPTRRLRRACSESTPTLSSTGVPRGRLSPATERCSAPSSSPW